MQGENITEDEDHIMAEYIKATGAELPFGSDDVTRGGAPNIIPGYGTIAAGGCVPGGGGAGGWFGQGGRGGIFGGPVVGGPLISVTVDPPPLPAGKLRVGQSFDADMASGRINEYRLTVNNPPTKQADDILTGVLPQVVRRFLEKNADYGNYASELGAKGQFADIWRKIGKLKRSLWEGQELSGEQPEEILEDLIGHVLLALLDLRTEQE